MQVASHIEFRASGEQYRRSVFLNFDPSPYNSPDLVDTEVKRLKAEAENRGLLASRIVCEIIETESSTDQLAQQLYAQLRIEGMKIAVDDYGTGHSGWERFVLVQPEILKLDGEVFRNLCRTPAAGPALKGLVSSLREVNCILLVEGIENQNQLNIAIDANVALFQGFHLAKLQTITVQHPRIPAVPFLSDMAPNIPPPIYSTGSTSPFTPVA